MYVCGGISAVQPHSVGGVMGGRRGCLTGTYTHMLHLHFRDLPLKKCPIGDLDASKIRVPKESPRSRDCREFSLIRTCSTTTRDRFICNFGAPSPLEALH